VWTSYTITFHGFLSHFGKYFLPFSVQWWLNPQIQGLHGDERGWAIRCYQTLPLRGWSGAKRSLDVIARVPQKTSCEWMFVTFSLLGFCVRVCFCYCFFTVFHCVDACCNDLSRLTLWRTTTSRTHQRAAMMCTSTSKRLVSAKVTKSGCAWLSIECCIPRVHSPKYLGPECKPFSFNLVFPHPNELKTYSRASAWFYSLWTALAFSPFRWGQPAVSWYTHFSYWGDKYVTILN